MPPPQLIVTVILPGLGSARFKTLIVNEQLNADSSSDLTVKHEVDQLTSATEYFYRFFLPDGRHFRLSHSAISCTDAISRSTASLALA